MAAGVEGCDLVHSHTWYANLAGHLAKLLYGVPHVVTSHSLEPQRPWKAEQLGGGYRLSSWAEQTAYEAADAIIAVSAGSKLDVLRSYPALDPALVHVVHNGIDTELYRPVAETDVVDRLGIDLDPPVGRVRRPDHPPEGRRRTCCGPPCSSTRGPRSCCSPGRPTRRSWPPRRRPPSPSCASGAAASCG